jgi:hypothetical protein
LIDVLTKSPADINILSLYALMAAATLKKRSFGGHDVSPQVYPWRDKMAPCKYCKRLASAGYFLVSFSGGKVKQMFR